MDSSTNETLPNNVENKSARILPLVLKNVSYEKAGMRLIKDLSVTFNFGSLTVILGPNGAGKSLLLRLCHGLIKPSKGTVDWCGPKVSVPQRYQAMVFQRPVMLRRSVIANLSHSLKYRGINKAERTQKIENILKKILILQNFRIKVLIQILHSVWELGMISQLLLKKRLNLYKITTEVSET